MKAIRSAQQDLKLPLYEQPCIHAAPLPGTLDNLLCVIGVEDKPTREHCRDVCPLRVAPQEYGMMYEHYKDNRKIFHHLVDAAAKKLQESRKKKGLGDMVESAIDVLTFGKAKKLMKAKEEKTGKPCGCNKRKEALNKMGEKIGLKSTGSNEEPLDAS